MKSSWPDTETNNIFIGMCFYVSIKSPFTLTHLVYRCSIAVILSLYAVSSSYAKKALIGCSDLFLAGNFIPAKNLSALGTGRSPMEPNQANIGHRETVRTYVSDFLPSQLQMCVQVHCRDETVLFSWPFLAFSHVFLLQLLYLISIVLSGYSLYCPVIVCTVRL